jgi:hypothetical protein
MSLGMDRRHIGAMLGAALAGAVLASLLVADDAYA